MIDVEKVQDLSTPYLVELRTKWQREIATLMGQVAVVNLVLEQRDADT